MSETITSAEIRDERRVHFSVAMHEMFEFEPDDVSIEDKWLSKEYCHKSKDKGQRQGRVWQRKGYDVLLKSSFENPCKDVQSKLDSFVRLGEDCIPRGIERFISPKHADERRYAKVHCIESVVDLCTYMRRQGKAMDEIEAELHSLSTGHSRSSRHFARRIAVADARAVLEDGVAEADVEKESVVTAKSEESNLSMVSAKAKKGLTFRARQRTKRLTEMITGHRSSGQR